MRRSESRRLSFRGMPQGSDEDYPEPFKAAFWLFLVFIGFTYLQAGIRFPILGAIRAEFLVGGALTVFAFILIGKSGRDFKFTSVATWGLGLVLLLLVMTILSFDFELSWEVFIDRVFKFSLIGLFISVFVTSPNRLRFFLLVYLLVMAKLGQEGLLGTITGSMIWENQGIPRLHGSTPSYLHPNSYSGVAVSTLPFIVFLFPLVSRKWKVALVILLLLMLNIVLRTGSRTGYVALFVGLLWFCIYARHRVRAFSAVLALSLLALPFIPEDYIDRAASIFEPVEVGENTSVGKRKEILVDAWEVFSRWPLGVGVGAFPTVREELFGRYQDTHNLYLEVATNAGVQGVIVFLGLIFAIIGVLRETDANAGRCLKRLGWGGARRGNERNVDSADQSGHVRDLLWIRGGSRAFLGFLTIRLALGMFGMDLYERYWWFLAGAAVALWNMSKRAESITERILDYERSSLGVASAG